MESLIINLISGVIGGNIAGVAMKDRSLGTLGNSLAGLVGGGIAAQLLVPTGASGIVAGIAAGGIGGAVMMILAGAIKKMLAK